MSAFSAIESLDGAAITIWVFHSDFLPSDSDKLRAVLSSFSNAKLEVQSLDLSRFAGLRGLHGEVMPFAKLLLPRLMAGKAERIVFLDADTVVVDGLRDLFRKDLEGFILGAVSYESLGMALESDFFEAEGLNLEKKGFNSGVMLIDVEGWKKDNKTEDLIDHVERTDPEKAASDQPFLNVAFYDNFLPLRIRYNKRASPGERLADQHTRDGILHFVGIPKPWDIGGKWFNENYELYEKYRRQAGISPRPSREVLQKDGWWRVVKGIGTGLRAAVK